MFHLIAYFKRESDGEREREREREREGRERERGRGEREVGKDSNEKIRGRKKKLYERIGRNWNNLRRWFS